MEQTKAKRKRRSKFLSALLAVCVVFSGGGMTVPVQADAEQTEQNTIVNGALWYDDRGENIQGHGGNILEYEGRYYWVGEYKENANFSGIALYSSSDLADWKFENMILTPDTPDDDGTIGFCTIERPKLIYNGSEFVLWAHWENGKDYGESKLIVAKCDTVNGDYEFVDRFNPKSRTYNAETGEYEITTNRSLDMTIYNDTETDADGTIHNQAYLISANGHNMALYKLTQDCMDVIPEESYQFWMGAGREAPALVKSGDYYVLVTSGQSGWYPNQSMYGYTKNITDPNGWTPADELKTIGNNSTFYSQPTNIAAIGDGQYIYMGDRWNPSALGKSTFVWLPLNIEAGEDGVAASMDYVDEWSFNAESGKVELPDSELVSQGKTAEASVAGSDAHPVEQAVDGICDTTSEWGNSNYFAPASVPFSYTIDLEEVYDLNRFDLSTRLCNGSETYYQYRVEGSNDKVNWEQILDESSNTTAAFRSNPVSGSYRYVRLTVDNVVNAHNGNGAAWAAGLVEVEVYASQKTASHKVLDILYEQYKSVEQGYYTRASYKEFQKALKTAKEILEKGEAAESEYKDAVKALKTAYEGLKKGAGTPVKVTGAVSDTATTAGTLPALAPVVMVETQEGLSAEAEIDWNISKEQFTSPYSTVSVEGVVRNTDLKVSCSVEVIPDNLIYFIDCGTQGTGSGAFNAVAASGIVLKNQVSDQAYSEESGWGILSGYDGAKTGEYADKFTTGYYGVNAAGKEKGYAYKFTLDAGEYDITVQSHEWWSGPRTSNFEAVYTTAAGESQSVMIAEGLSVGNGYSPNAIGSGRLTLEEKTEVQLNVYASTNQGAVITFLGIAKTGEKPDKGELIRLYEANKDKESEKYTEESWRAFKEALDRADAVIRNEEADAEMVKNAKNSLVEAVLNLRVDKSVHTDVLETLIGLNKSKNPEDYTKDSWAAFEQTLSAAVNLLEQGEYTQVSVDEAANAILEAAGKLTASAKADKTDLQALASVFEEKDLSIYTRETRDICQAAFDNMQTVLENDSAVQADVDRAAEAVTDAVAGLELQEIGEGGTIIGLSNLLELCVQYREENYTQDNWSIYSEKKQAAEALLQKLSVTEIVAEKEESEDTAADISQAEIDAAAAELYSAMKGLVKIQKENLADKTGLQNLYKMTGILSESDYTAESWEKLVKAQEAAKVVLDSELADQQKTDEAANALLQAAKELVREEDAAKQADKTSLQNVYDVCAGYLEENYTKESWEAFKAAKEQAGVVLQKEDASQAEIDQAKDTLLTAIKGLVQAEQPQIADKSSLQQLFNAASKLNKEDFTEESWKALQAAMESVKSLLASEEASQEEVNTAADALDKAVKGLKAADKKELSDKEKNTNNGTDTGNKKNPKANAGNAAKIKTGGVKTGDSTPIALFIGTGGIALAGITYLLASRRKRNK